MQTHAQLTEREREVVTTLTHKVRVLTLEQVARTWWPALKTGQEAARRTLARLSAAGYIQVGSYLTEPELVLGSPIATWTPGQPPINAARISYTLQKRWTKPPRTSAIYLAGPRARKRFGGVGGPLKHLHQVTHDLHLAAIYLTYLEHSDATHWVGEHILSKLFSDEPKTPDAAILLPDGSIERFVEFGGKYALQRVEGFHRFCHSRNTPYELW